MKPPRPKLFHPFKNMNSFVLLVVMGSLLMLHSGCGLGPQRLQGGYAQYNEAIRRVSDEQLLLKSGSASIPRNPSFPSNSWNYVHLLGGRQSGRECHPAV